MTSGLPHPQWNNADVTDSSLVDIDDVRDWYRQHDVPWGARVPTQMPWPHGQLALSQRLMGQGRAQFTPAAPVQGVTVGVAGPDDLERVLMVDALAFEGDVDISRPWMTPMLHHPSVTVAIAVDDEGPVGTGYAVLSDAHAGPAAYIGGVAVLQRVRRRGIGTAVSSWLLEHAYAAGAQITSLQPDTDVAARVYARLGFVDAVNYDIYVDASPENGDEVPGIGV
jgi:GNAT superfamily N-acetyltransferase